MAVSLMLALHVGSWKDITRYSNACNAQVNLTALANGLTRSGFIDWFAHTMSIQLNGFSPNMAVVALVRLSYSAYTTTLLSVILPVGKGRPGVPCNSCQCN